MNNHLTEREPVTVSGHRNDASIMLLPADRGRAMVIIDRLDYIQKFTTLLNDDTRCKRLSTNLLTTATNQINRLKITATYDDHVTQL